MTFKQFGCAVAAASVLAGCGGSGDTTQAPSEPFVNFVVALDTNYDGVQETGYSWAKDMKANPFEITAPWGQLDSSAGYDSCDTAVYANAQYIKDNYPSYCITERSFVSVTFKFQYTNPTYESLPVDFDGLGYEIHIYKYANGVMGDEVWNSSYEAQRVVDDYVGKYPSETVADFDPTITSSVTLKASDSFPSYATFSNVTFRGNKNFQDGYAAYNPDGLYKSPDESTEELCDWTLAYNAAELKWNQVECLGDLSPLPAPGSTDTVQFLVKVTINFNDYVEQPPDILLTFTSPN